MKKLRFIFVLNILLLNILTFNNCSSGVIIPQPVCDYGAAVCETLSLLCSGQTMLPMNEEQIHSLESYLKEVNDSLRTYLQHN